MKKKRTKNATLKSLLKIILYENPSTQAEIAKKLGISRRYVTKLLQPLINKGVVKKAYILDIGKFEEFSKVFGEDKAKDEHPGSFFIKEILRKMSEHVSKQLKNSFESLLKHDEELAQKSLKMDYTTNNMHEKIRSSVETALALNPYSEFSKTLIFAEIAYDLERIGDHSCTIADFVVKEKKPVGEFIRGYLEDMFKLANKMLNLSMEAFLNEKLEFKNKIMRFEDRMHKLQKEALNQIAIEMAETKFINKEESTYYISLARVVKAFERIADISIEIVDTASEYYLNIPRTTIPERFRRLESKNGV